MEKHIEKIKIVFIETNCKENGPIKQTFNIIKYMDKSIFEPILITLWVEDKDNSMLDKYKELNISVICLEMSKISTLLFGKQKIKRVLKNIEPDIVQGVGMPLYRITLGYKKTIHFLTLRNYCIEDYPDYYGNIIGKILAICDIKLIRRKVIKGEKFVTCSESLKKIYKEKENIELACISNGVDISLYTKKDIEKIPELRKKLNLPLDKKIFIYSGKFIERKNQREAIEGYLNMKNKDDTALLFIGGGKGQIELEKIYGKYKNIIFRDEVYNVNEYLNACDVYISTSKSEGLPNGVLEAMACGLPLVLSDIPQHMEILGAEKGCGYSYKLGNINDLTKYLDKIFYDDIKKMGDISYKIVTEKFTAEKMSEKYQDLYMKMIRSVD